MMSVYECKMYLHLHCISRLAYILLTEESSESTSILLIPCQPEQSVKTYGNLLWICFELTMKMLSLLKIVFDLCFQNIRQGKNLNKQSQSGKSTNLKLYCSYVHNFVNTKIRYHEHFSVPKIIFSILVNRQILERSFMHEMKRRSLKQNRSSLQLIVQ